jgi:hypothetical protein
MCGFFMRYNDDENTGDCASIGMNKECYEGVNPFLCEKSYIDECTPKYDYTPILQVSSNDEACGFFRNTRTPRIRKYIKDHPQYYKQLKWRIKNQTKIEL